MELDPSALDWVDGSRVRGVAGDAGDEAVLGEAADAAEAAGRLVGWVNNAAVFRDVPIPATPTPEVLAAAELHPLGRVARPEEIATAVAFLLSAAASFLTRATLPMDGGRTILGREPQA